MPIYKPSELRCFLERWGIVPNKRLSQNFLVDGNIVRKIVQAAEVQAGDAVLEIGPGPGALTETLLEAGARLLAIEKDKALSRALERLSGPEVPLTILCQDILSFAIAQELPCFISEGSKAKVVANLPYGLTAPILAKLMPCYPFFDALTVVVQEEVARRATAQPGTAEYGAFTLFLRFYAEVQYAFAVSRYCCYPVPLVDSAVLTLKLRSPPLSHEESLSFFKLTRTAFEQRRKMLRVSLKSLFAPQRIEAALGAIGQNPLARPEMLSLEQFLQLHAQLHGQEEPVCYA